MTDVSAGAMEDLRSLVYTSFRFPFLQAAMRLGLFTLLKERPASTREEIADALGLADRAGHVLLLGCCAFELVRKDGDGYHNTATTELIADDPDGFMPVIIRYTQEMLYRPMGRLYESLVHNENAGLQRELLAGSSATTLYELLAEDKNLETAFTAMMEHHGRAVVQDLIDAVDFSSYRQVLDVGGGTGTNAISFAQRWPHLRATILDLPNVAKLATDRIAEAGLSERVQAVGTDIMQDEFPGTHDCIVFSRFLEIWSPERVRGLFEKAYRALEPGGHLLIVACAQNDDETGPAHAAWMSAYVHAVASPEGRSYTTAEFEKWYTEAGFETVDRQYPGLFDVIIRARKPAAAPDRA
ncbi:acetylserotonin O-methyltransferase [Amycolatopsis sp. OK19-0408]|uniref:Acetylserotonin O-methyltransferase n=1 Tax=Amycolatopsis iheyensis TaxID=2945988 RepID=A0A9X2NIF6_9PSEU|nr:acetylserotonin O-methyltransferase [Amycolatopsis iheyensis]MCR6488443.1 acetylserotonin O-methyltransferase [Amycolatopsis iheyensis]